MLNITTKIPFIKDEKITIYHENLSTPPSPSPSYSTSPHVSTMVSPLDFRFQHTISPSNRPHKMTIVTAFISNINERNDRSLDDYLKLGKELLKVDIPKIMFIDKAIYQEHFQGKTNDKNLENPIKYEYPYTTFIPIEKKDMYLFHYKEMANQYDIVTGNTKKDTIEFMFVQCMKTEWIKQAIELDIYNTDQFVWVDFGILHFIQDPVALREGLHFMETKAYNGVRIPCGKSPDFPYYTRNVYHQIIWMFIGSLFGGNKSSLVHFANIMKKKCIEILTQKRHIMWEINIWYLLFFEHVNLFDRYMSDHSPKILFDY